MLKPTIINHIENLVNIYNRKTASMNRFYVIDYDTEILYGPFNDEDEAIKANYFLKSVNESDKAAKAFPSGVQMRVLLNSGVLLYGDDYIQTISKDPKEWGSSWTVLKPAKEIPMHPSWKEFSEESREFIYNYITESI